jgi:hypothetical protein
MRGATPWCLHLTPDERIRQLANAPNIFDVEPDALLSLNKIAQSGPRYAAFRIVSPIAVEPGDAKIDAPVHADHPGILGDRIIDRVLGTVIDHGGAAAIAARNGLCGPRHRVDLADILEANDAQFRIPEAEFLSTKIADDAVECRWILANRHIAIVARTGQPEILLEPTRRSRLRDEDNAER